MHDLIIIGGGPAALSAAFYALDIFAAGDVTATPGEQVFVAIGDGARAAMSAYEYCLAQRLALTQIG